MKTKKIPLIVKLYLMIIGYWIGTIVTMICNMLGLMGWTNTYYVLVVIFLLSILAFYITTWRYRTTLEEYDILEPKKEK